MSQRMVVHTFTWGSSFEAQFISFIVLMLG